MEGVELLESDRQNKLIELIKKLYDEEYEKMKSCLVILYNNNKEHNIFKSLESLNNKKSLNVTESEIQSLKIENSKVKGFLSDLYDTDEIDLLNEFLFSSELQKCMYK